MTHYDAMSGLTGYAVTSPDSQSLDPISYIPSIMGDATAALEQLLSAESCASFNQTQFRSVAENLSGLGLLASQWA